MTPRGPIRWAYANRSLALQESAPDDFEVHRIPYSKWRPYLAQDYQLVFCLDYTASDHLLRDWNQHQIRALRVMSFNKDHRTKHTNYYATVETASWTIINNFDRYILPSVQPRTCHIGNGVSSFWCPPPKMAWPERALWTGSSNPAKTKRFDEIIKPLGERLSQMGLDFSFRPINEFTAETVYTPTEQRDWYWSGDIAVCASLSEGGGPSFLLEAAACGCIPISTICGDTGRWVGRSGFLVADPPTVETYVRLILEARQYARIVRLRSLENMQRRAYGGPNGIAQWFFALFRKLIDDGPEAIKPFTFETTHFTEI